MRFVVLAILLAFPVADVCADPRASRAGPASRCGCWLVGSFLVGLLLLRNERIAFRSRTAAALARRAALMRGLLDSGRKVLAGFLLMLPGVVSDLMALAAAAAAANVGRGSSPSPRTAYAAQRVDGDVTGSRRSASRAPTRRGLPDARAPAVYHQFGRCVERDSRRPGPRPQRRYFIRSMTVGSALPARR